jgi:hypothetical protein
MAQFHPFLRFFRAIGFEEFREQPGNILSRPDRALNPCAQAGHAH